MILPGITHRKPEGDQLDQANPVRKEDTGLWQCPFCLKNDFPELSEVTSLNAQCLPFVLQCLNLTFYISQVYSGVRYLKTLTELNSFFLFFL